MRKRRFKHPERAPEIALPCRRTHGMKKEILMEKLKKVNIIDLIVVVIIVLVALVALGKAVIGLLPDASDPGTSGSAPGTSAVAPGASATTPGTAAPSQDTTPSAGTGTQTTTKPAEKPKEEKKVGVTYTVRAESVAAELYETVQSKLPCQLMESGAMQQAWIVSVEKEPAMVLAENGTWVVDPDHVDLLLTVEADVVHGTVMNTLVGTQEVRIGRPNYSLITQELEFAGTTVVDVTWEEHTPSAELTAADIEAVMKKGLKPMTFVVRAENHPVEVYENIRDYVPGRLMASGTMLYGNVVSVEREPVMVLTADGTWVEDPEHVTMLFTVQGIVFANKNQSPVMGNQNVRI